MLRVILISWLLFMTAVLLAPQSALDRTHEILSSVSWVRARHETALYQRLSNDHTAWHGILFGVLSLLAIVQWRRLRWTSVVSCLILLTLYSLATELLQEHFIPGRAFVWYDLLINQIGIVSGLGLGLVIRVLTGRIFTDTPLPRCPSM